jgi:hypothetical protein
MHSVKGQVEETQSFENRRTRIAGGLSMDSEFVHGGRRLRATFSVGVSGILSRVGLLLFVILAVESSQDVAYAQGAITNGATHAGVIQVGGLHSWTFQAAANDSITVSLGEVVGSGSDPVFWPWLRLRAPNGAQLGDDFGAFAAQIDVRAPLTGTYTVLVAGADAGCGPPPMRPHRSRELRAHCGEDTWPVHRVAKR